MAFKDLNRKDRREVADLVAARVALAIIGGVLLYLTCAIVAETRR